MGKKLAKRIMNLIKIPLRSGGCYILLTEAEYLRGLARGKRDRRAQAHERRQHRGEGSLTEVLDDDQENECPCPDLVAAIRDLQMAVTALTDERRWLCQAIPAGGARRIASEVGGRCRMGRR